MITFFISLSICKKIRNFSRNMKFPHHGPELFWGNPSCYQSDCVSMWIHFQSNHDFICDTWAIQLGKLVLHLKENIKGQQTFLSHVRFYGKDIGFWMARCGLFKDYQQSNHMFTAQSWTLQTFFAAFLVNA